VTPITMRDAATLRYGSSKLMTLAFTLESVRLTAICELYS